MRPFIRNILAAGLFSICAAGQINAEGLRCGDDACALKTYIDPARRAVAIHIANFKPFLEKDFQYLADKGSVQIPMAANFNAYVDYENRIILIPAQFVFETSFLCEALARVSTEPKMMRAFKNYELYLLQRSAMARKKGGTDSEPTKNFSAFLNETDEQFSKANSAEMRSRFIGCISNALAFTLAHEIGHLVLKHRSPSNITPKESRKQERDADEYSISLLHKADFKNISGAASVLHRFASSEVALGPIDREFRTHPLAECRIFRFANAEVMRNGETEEFRANIKAAGASLATWKSEWRALEKRCNDDEN